MDIRIVTKKFELNDKDKDTIERHFTKFTKVLREPYTVTCTIERKSNSQLKLELTIDERKLYRIETYADSLENAVDDVELRMYRTLRKAKEKSNTFKTKSVRRREEMQFNDNVEDRAVSKVKRFPIKPCSVEDAIDAMFETDHDFYVFCNEETQSNDVVYVRKDGSIGLIQLV